MKYPALNKTLEDVLKVNTRRININRPWDQPWNFQFYSQFEWKSQSYFFRTLSMSKLQIHWGKILNSQLLSSKWSWFNTYVPDVLACNIVVMGSPFPSIRPLISVQMSWNLVVMKIDFALFEIWIWASRDLILLTSSGVIIIENGKNMETLFQNLYLFNIMNNDKIVY